MHGIESEVNSDTAYLDRSALYMPDEIPTLRRARYELTTLVHSARHCKYLYRRLRESHFLVAGTNSTQPLETTLLFIVCACSSCMLWARSRNDRGKMD